MSKMVLAEDGCRSQLNLSSAWRNSLFELSIVEWRADGCTACPLPFGLWQQATSLSPSLSSRSHYKHNLRTEFTVTAAVSVTRFLSSLNSQADRRRGQGRGKRGREDAKKSLRSRSIDRRHSSPDALFPRFSSCLLHVSCSVLRPIPHDGACSNSTDAG